MNSVLNNRPLDRNGCCVRLHHCMKDLGIYCSVAYLHSLMACTKPFTHVTELCYIDFKSKKKKINLLYHVRSYNVKTYSNTVTCFNSQFNSNEGQD